MSNSSKSMWQVIPLPAKVVAAILYVALGLVVRLAAIESDPKMAEWHEWQKVLFAFGVILVVPIYVLFIGYVNGDAKRRGMRSAVWTWAAALVPNALGIILYFLLRDPLLVSCPSCGMQANKGFAYCPKCGIELAPACPACQKPVERGWSNCPYCGKKLSAEATNTAGLLSPSQES